MTLNGLACCGWGELDGLAYVDEDLTFPQKIGMLAADNYLYADQGAILFNQANYRKNGKNDYGAVFAKQVEEHGLGTVVKLPLFINPNHNSYIQSYVWIINRKAIKTFLKKHKLGEYGKRYWG